MGLDDDLLRISKRTLGEQSAGKARVQFYAWQEATDNMKQEVMVNIKLDNVGQEQYALIVAEIHRALKDVRAIAIALGQPNEKPPSFILQTAIGSFDETQDPS